MASQSDGIAFPNALIVQFSVKSGVARNCEFLNFGVVGGFLQIITSFDIVVTVTPGIVALDYQVGIGRKFAFVILNRTSLYELNWMALMKLHKKIIKLVVNPRPAGRSGLWGSHSASKSRQFKKNECLYNSYLGKIPGIKMNFSGIEWASPWIPIKICQ